MSLLLFAFNFGGCKKDSDDVNTLWVYYNETQCNDPWGAHEVVDEEKKKNIIDYFGDKGVEIYQVKFSKGNIHPDCALCACISGTTILGEIKKEDLTLMEAEGFLQYK